MSRKIQHLKQQAVWSLSLLGVNKNWRPSLDMVMTAADKTRRAAKRVWDGRRRMWVPNYTQENARNLKFIGKLAGLNPEGEGQFPEYYWLAQRNYASGKWVQS